MNQYTSDMDDAPMKVSVLRRGTLTRAFNVPNANAKSRHSKVYLHQILRATWKTTQPAKRDRINLAPNSTSLHSNCPIRVPVTKSQIALASSIPPTHSKRSRKRAPNCRQRDRTPSICTLGPIIHSAVTVRSHRSDNGRPPLLLHVDE